MERIQNLLDDGVITYDGELAKPTAPIMMATHDPLVDTRYDPVNENSKISDSSNMLLLSDNISKKPSNHNNVIINKVTPRTTPHTEVLQMISSIFATDVKPPL